MMHPVVREVLEEDIQGWMRRLQRPLIDKLMRDFASWPELVKADFFEGMEGIPPKGVAVQQWVRFLSHHIDELSGAIAQLKRQHALFMHRYDASATREERRRHMLEYAATLGATPQVLAEDRKAFSRWFDLDALKDRFQRRISEKERELAFSLDRLGSMSARLLADSEEGWEKVWHRLTLEERIRPLMAFEGDARVAVSAFACLRKGLAMLPSTFRSKSISEATHHYIFRSALESRYSVGVQCAALEILPLLSPDAFVAVVRKRLQEPVPKKDDIFVRAKAISLLGDHPVDEARLRELIQLGIGDPSPYVRQTLARMLCKLDGIDVRPWLQHLVRDDEDGKVRAATLVAMSQSMQGHAKLRPWMLDTYEAVLSKEEDPFVLRTAMTMAAERFRCFAEDDAWDETEKALWMRRLLDALNSVHGHAPSLQSRRHAALAAEKIWVYGDEDARRLLAQLEGVLRNIRPGYSKRILKADYPIAERKTLGRVLSYIAQEDFGFDVVEQRKAWIVTRGWVFQFRFWRLWHELTHPSPDKRQAYPHVIGRRFIGTLRAPSSIMAEVTPTKVPGEPLLIEEEGGWRPYLPLVDEVVSALNHGVVPRTIEIYTSEGVTRIHPPKSLFRRLWSLAKVNFRFAQYARMRDWDNDDTLAPNSYTKALERLGFKVEYKTHEYPYLGHFSSDPNVTRFFPALIPFGDWWTRFADYAFTPYENTLFDLLLFASVGFLIFFARHFRINRRIREIRRKIPFVMGGWGTRGKSGVERLKAAILNGMGFGLVSKTTGCEAMFLHAPPFRKLREMFLFRPYDKASIWEQADLLKVADRLQPEAFLWECMALAPHYVRVLQQDWMRDDLATITNTFPDHEDIQGPAGINIAEVMTDFIPRKAKLFTSEEQMTPILHEAAKRRGTRLHRVGWLEAGLLTDDILDRFPYAEHPYNIALALAVARELEIDEQAALQYMADHVVPDIGVLKRFPMAPVSGRNLEFINGMSANERYGCLQNWRRMGFADHDPIADPSTWITTLVNNRADRVSRSIMFADILARDLSADRHFLIGTNLHGMMGYLRKAWDARLQEVTLFPADGERDRVGAACERLKRSARWMRVPLQDSQLKDGLKAMLATGRGRFDMQQAIDLWREPEALKELLQDEDEEWRESILTHHTQRLQQYHEFLDMLQRIQSNEEEAALDHAFRQLLTHWFMSKFVVIEDPYATGEQIIRRIVDVTPPGFKNRIMGLQNIKGTGLDFVYRWQDWERCYQACQKLYSDDPYVVGEGLNTLMAMTEYGQLCEEYLRKTIAFVRHQSPLGSRQRFQAELNVVESNLEQAMTEVRSQLRHQHRQGWIERLILLIEAFLDAGNAVRRRKIANQIYEDLANERISHDRASVELRKLTQSQKGGWLLKSLDRIQEFFLRS